MPELPEVETVVRDLRPLLIGRSFAKIAVSKKALRRKWSRTWEAQLLRQQVQAIQRRGKWILIAVTGAPLTPGPSPPEGRGEARRPSPPEGRGEARRPTPPEGRGEARRPSPPEGRGEARRPSPPEGRGEAWLLVHLGMTGQFTVVGKSPRETHTHIVFTLDDGNELRFRDVRRFGSVSFYPSRAALDAVFIDNGLGPEPFDLDVAYWRETLRATKRNLKAILLDQSVIAGVGNIYADESLFEARLHPTIVGQAIAPRQAERLRDAVMRVLTRAIELRGSSIRDYIGGSGLKGAMQHEFRVYGRTGDPCLRCGTPIERLTLAGRSTHFCPKCQRKRA